MKINLYLQELGISFIKIAATEVVSGVSGDSEEKIRDLFDKAAVSEVTSYLRLVNLDCQQ